MTVIKILKKVPIFEGFSTSELEEIERLLTAMEVSAGEDIFFESEPGKNFYILYEGRIKIYKMSSEGQIKVLDYLEKGDFFGEMALLDNTSRSANAVVVTDSVLLKLRQADFDKLMISRPELLMRITRTLSARLRRADCEIELLSFSGVKNRLIQCIYNLAEKYGEETPDGLLIPSEFTHKDISELVGTAREVVSRVIKELKEEGLVKTDGRSLIIRDLPSLLEKIKD